MVDEGIVTSDQLTHALAEQDRTGRPLGEILVELGFASAGAVANALAEQHGGLLKTEYGVSAGMRAVTDAGLANVPVRPVLPPPEERLAPKPEAQEEAAVPLRVIVTDPPEDDGPPVAPTPTVAAPEQPALVPNAEEARIADLTARLDEAVSQLRVSQQARDAFSKRATELEAQLASGAEPQADPAAAARIQQLEAHIQQLDAHIQAAAADRENIVEHYTQLQAQLAAVQAATPEPDPAQQTRIQELEAQLQAAAVDRQQLVESLTELQSRLGEASQAREEERSEASAGAAARVSVLEGQLKEATLDAGALQRRVAELQGALLASEQTRVGEIQTAMAEAQARIEELELQLQQAALNASAESESSYGAEQARVAELEAQLQAVSDEREAVLAGLADHDATTMALREELADRDRQLADNVNEIARMNREHRGPVEQLSAALARIAELESGDAAESGQLAELQAQLQAVTDERDALASRDADAPTSSAEHETTIAALHKELADRDRQLAQRAALVESVEHDAMVGLREELVERDRRLAENVSELARLNRELAESVEREAAMTNLREELADRDRRLTERRKLVENIEHAAMTELREDLTERDRLLAEQAEEVARTSDELAERDRKLAEIADEIARMNSAHEATMTRLREDLANRDRLLAESLDELAQLRERAEALAAAGADVDEEQEHVLFIPTSSGYSLLERSGAAPELGAPVEIDGDSENAGQFVVRKHGRPLPGGPRCAYLERA
jgi:chromosome segregation ATPase